MNCSSISMYPFGNLNTMKIEIIQGDDYTAKLQVTDENGIIDHTLISKIYFTSKGANINKTFVYEEEVESYFLYLNPEETYEINKGTYSFDITIYFVSPHTQTKIYRGDLIVKEKINDPLTTKPERYTNEEINELLGQRELRFVKGNAEELDIVPNETICYSFTPLKYYKNFDCINEYIGSYVDNGLSKTLVNEFNKNSLGIKPGVTIAYEKKTVGPFDEISKYYGYYTGLSEDSLVKILAPHLLKSDLVDDNEQVNKFVTEEEKEQITTNKNSIQELQIELNSKANLDYVNSQFNTKVDKVEGKQLSTNDYTNEDKSKVNIITTEGSSDKFLNEQGEYVALQVSTDQTYNPNSTNAQSGKAVAQAIADNVIDDNYVHTDNNYTNQDKAQVEKISDIESELNNKVDKIEGRITNALTDQLASAQNPAEQFRIFERFRLIIKIYNKIINKKLNKIQLLLNIHHNKQQLKLTHNLLLLIHTHSHLLKHILNLQHKHTNNLQHKHIHSLQLKHTHSQLHKHIHNQLHKHTLNPQLLLIISQPLKHIHHLQPKLTPNHLLLHILNQLVLQLTHNQLLKPILSLQQQLPMLNLQLKPILNQLLQLHTPSQQLKLILNQQLLTNHQLHLQLHNQLLQHIKQQLNNQLLKLIQK